MDADSSDDDSVGSYIYQRALDYGIDPRVALRVYQSEGASGYTGDGGSSFGPFQLHYGGVNQNMSHPGLGDAFTQATGLDARDRRTWRQQVDFALQHASQNGWGAWMGAAKSGVSNFAGIGQAPRANTDVLMSAPPDLLGQWNAAVQNKDAIAVKAATGIATGAPSILEEPVPDLLGQWSQSLQTAPAAPQNVAPQAASVAPQTVMGGPGGGLTVMNSLPVAGPLSLKAGAAINALASSYIGGGAPGAEGSFSQRYANERVLQASQMADYAAQHPAATLAEQLASGLIGSGAMVAAAPAAFGINSGASLAANALAAFGTNAGLSGADMAARGGSMSDIGRSAAVGGALGAAAPVLGAGLGALGRGVSGGVVPADDAQLAQLAMRKYGIPLTAPQVSASPGFKIAGSTLNRLPFSGAEGDVASQQSAFNRAVAGTIGESADKITPAVMNAARARIGASYDAVAQNTVINVDSQFLQDLHDTLNSASQVLPKAETEPLIRQAQNILEKVDRTTKTIPGDVYQALTNTGAPLDRLIESENPNVSFFANGLKKTLDSALERSASPDQQELLKTADRQWAAMRTIQPIVAKSTGDVSPALLAGRVNAATGNGMAFGYGGDLGELARIGQKFLKEPGSSNTAERLATMAGTIGGIPNALLAAAHGDLWGAAGTAFGVPLASLAVGRGVGSALRSRALANALITRSLPGAAGPTTPSWLAAMPLAGSAGSNALSVGQ